MTKERLEEIKDSIEFQMQVQQSLGYRSSYDDLLTEEIDLYNEVIDLQERINKAINDLEITIQIICEQPSKNVKEGNYILSRLEGFIKILKGESNNENSK